MKNKLFTALKQEHSSLGLADEILQGHAEALAATGLVTDENLTAVVKAQKGALSVVQSSLDRERTAKANAEKELKAKVEGAPTSEQNEPEWFKAYRTKQEAEIASIKGETEAAKVLRAKEERTSMVSRISKELGIPEWRQKEGFAISDEMDETAVKNYLSGVKANITAAGLEPEKSAFSLSTNDALAKEEAKVWAANLPDK